MLCLVAPKNYYICILLITSVSKRSLLKFLHFDRYSGVNVDFLFIDTVAFKFYNIVEDTICKVSSTLRASIFFSVNGVKRSAQSINIL